MDNEKKEYLKKLIQQRGYVLDFHKILAAESFEFLKRYNEFSEAAYTKPGVINRKTKELIFITILAVERSSKEHIKLHIDLALKNGATKEEIFEVLNLICLVDGASTYLWVFDALKESIPLSKLEPDS